MTKTKKLIIAIIAIVVVVVVVIVIVILSMNNGTADKINQNGENVENSTEQKVILDFDKKNYDAVVKSVEGMGDKASADELIDAGIAYFNLKKLDKAVEMYKLAIAKDPQSAHAYNNLANILRDQRKYSEAEQNYRKSISLDKSYVSAYVNLADMLYSNGNKQGAIAVVQNGITANPQDQTLKMLLTEYSK